MRLTPENKAKIRRRILAGAADLMRRNGVQRVSIDDVMAAAGLTRGAFYAHFASKAELIAAVVREDHYLLAHLRSRRAEESAGLWRELRETFDAYLDPANLPAVVGGCTLATLAGDVARGDRAVRAAFESAWQDLLAEMARGQCVTDGAALSAALVLATGAVATAAASSDVDHVANVLASARRNFGRLADGACRRR